MLYLAGGKPAAGARVRVYPVGYQPYADSTTPPAFVTTSDKDGRYYIDGQGPGKYNVLGDLDGLSALLDSVDLRTTADALAPDTLRRPGILCGYVGLQPGDVPSTATVQVLGTYAYANVGTDGFFELPGLARGEYRAVVATTLSDYTPLHTSLSIRVGAKDTLSDTLKPIYTGVPRVVGLQIEFDTLNQVAKISWNAIKFPTFDGYLIFRDVKGVTERSPLALNVTSDTVYFDTLPALPSSIGDTTFQERSFDYRVVARDFSRAEGKVVEIKSLTAPSRAYAATFIRLRLDRPAGGLVHPGDSVSIIAEFSNKTRPLTLLRWFMDSASTPIRQLTSLKSEGADTLRFTAPSDPSEMHIRAQVTDNSGKEWGEDLQLDVIGAAKVTVDTLRQQVRLSWPPVQVPGLRQYLVFREPKGSAFSQTVPIGRSTDSTYTDDLLSTDFETDSSSELIREFDYRVAYLDDSGQVSHAIATASASLPAAVFVKTFATLRASGTDNGDASINDTLDFALDFSNRTRTITSLVWNLLVPNGSSRNYVVSAKHGQDHFRIKAPGTPGTYEVSAALTDDAGSQLTFKQSFKVVSDPPKVDLGNELSVVTGQPVKLYATGSDRFGKILKWEWDIGAKGAFVTGSGNDTSFTAPSAPDSNFLCVVRATDDDGEQASDTVRVRVLPWKRGSTIPQWKIDDCAAGFDGKAFLFGGKVLNGTQADMTAKAHVYDPDIDVWEAIPDMDVPRSECQAGATDSAILVFGGKIKSGFGEVVTDKVSQYDPVNRSWISKKPMPHARTGFNIAYSGGKFYLFGGNADNGSSMDTMDVYDPALDAWQSQTELPGNWKTSLGSSATAIGPEIFVISRSFSMSFALEGFNLNSFSRKQYASASISDQQGTTDHVAPKLVPIDGQLFMVGGLGTPYTGGYVFPKQVLIFNPASNAWSPWFPLPEGRTPDCLVSTKSRIFVIGGVGENGKSRETIDWAEVK
jgi:hypothetical protein